MCGLVIRVAFATLILFIFVPEMCTVTEMRQRFEVLRDNIIPIAGEAMMEHKDEIVGLVITQQYDLNIDSEGNPLRAYSQPYKNYKTLSGKSGKTDLEDTGFFHSTMNLRVDVGSDEYEINSPAQTDKGELKSEWLTEWNGSDIMDLTTENKVVTFEIILPNIIESAKEILQL